MKASRVWEARLSVVVREMKKEDKEGVLP